MPYYKISYSYDVQGNNHRVSAYAQDQWSAGNLTLNLGLRMDHIRGYSPVLKQDVYKPKNAWGPRVGIAYDMTGSGTSVLKGFWGRYYEGAASGFYSSATPGISDYVTTDINPDGSLGASYIDPAVVYGISTDIKHPRTDELNVAWETQINKDMRFTATGVYRTGGNFLNNVLQDALWQPVTLDNAFTGSTFTGYAWANRDESNTSYYIRNTKGFQYLDTNGNVIGTADPKRNYKALILVLNRSLKQRLGFQLSYVLSKSDGTVDNSGWSAYLSGQLWSTPNTALINSDGELTNSRRHEFKFYVTYLIPRIDVMISPQYTGTSGRPYQPVLSVQLEGPQPALLEPAVDQPRAARQRGERLLQQHRPPRREVLPGGWRAPVRGLCRHPQRVQHRVDHGGEHALPVHHHQRQPGALSGAHRISRAHVRPPSAVAGRSRLEWSSPRAARRAPRISGQGSGGRG